MHTTMVENKKKKNISIMRYIILHNYKYRIDKEMNQLEHVV